MYAALLPRRCWAGSGGSKFYDDGSFRSPRSLTLCLLTNAPSCRLLSSQRSSSFFLSLLPLLSSLFLVSFEPAARLTENMAATISVMAATINIMAATSDAAAAGVRVVLCARYCRCRVSRCPLRRPRSLSAHGAVAFWAERCPRASPPRFRFSALAGAACCPHRLPSVSAFSWAGRLPRRAAATGSGRCAAGLL